MAVLLVRSMAEKWVVLRVDTTVDLMAAPLADSTVAWKAGSKVGSKVEQKVGTTVGSMVVSSVD